MKLTLFLIVSLAIFSCNAVPGGWQAESLIIDDQLLKSLKTCLNKINQQPSGLSFSQSATISQVYLHLIQVVNGLNHKVTFQVQDNNKVKLVQVMYNQDTQNSITLMNFNVLDELISFDKLTGFVTEETLENEIIEALKILKPEVTYGIRGSLLAVAQGTNLQGTDFYTANAVLQGTDNRLSQFEFVFKKDAQGLDLFSYVQLRPNQKSLEQSSNLQVVKNQGKIECSSVSSYFLCTALAHCSSNDFVSSFECKEKNAAISF